MKKELFLTVDQAKHLQKLGLDMSNAVFCWTPPILEGEQWEITPITEGIRDVLQGKEPHIVTPVIPTYTLQEVLDKLPTDINYENRTYRLIYDSYHEVLFYASQERGYVKCFQNKMLIAAYEMLCWVLENGNL